MNFDPQTRRTFIIIGSVAAVLLLVGIVVSGRPGDAIYDGPPVVVETAGEADVIEAGDEVAGAEIDASGQTAGADNLTGDDVAAADQIDESAPADGGEAIEAESAPTAGPQDDQADTTSAGVSEPTPEAEGTGGEAAQNTAQTETDTLEAEEQASDDAQAPVNEAAASADEDAAEAEVAMAGDPAAGERVFRQCQACHMVGDGAQNRVGPLLTGVVGRAVASVEGFRYSDALQARGEEGLSWTPEELASFLANPRGYVSGTSMAFAGLRSEDDIADVIAYLEAAQ
jgi:cytochrome c2